MSAKSKDPESTGRIKYIARSSVTKEVIRGTFCSDFNASGALLSPIAISFLLSVTRFSSFLEDGILYIKDCREDPGSCLVGLQKNSTNQKTEQTILLYTLNETKFSHMIPVVAQSTVPIPQMISSNLHDIKQQIYTGKLCSYFLSHKNTNLDY
jgi:hypothetical protein